MALEPFAPTPLTPEDLFGELEGLSQEELAPFFDPSFVKEPTFDQELFADSVLLPMSVEEIISSEEEIIVPPEWADISFSEKEIISPISPVYSEDESDSVTESFHDYDEFEPCSEDSDVDNYWDGFAPPETPEQDIVLIDLTQEDSETEEQWEYGSSLETALLV